MQVYLSSDSLMLHGSTYNEGNLEHVRGEANTKDSHANGCHGRGVAQDENCGVLGGDESAISMRETVIAPMDTFLSLGEVLSEEDTSLY